MIRPATEPDVPAMLVLGAQMHAESPVFRRLRFDAERLAVTIRNVIQSPAGFAWVVEVDGDVVGGLLAVATPHWCSGDLVACDLALFMRQDYRGGLSAVRLLQRYRKWAQDVGAVITQMGVMTGIAQDRTEALLSGLGWDRVGVVMEAA